MKKTLFIPFILFLTFSLAFGEFSSPATFRDPFTPQLPAKAANIPAQAPAEQNTVIALPAVSVSGLIWNTNRPQAIINNQVVDVGDTVNNIKILEITKSGIGVLYQGKNFVIPNNQKGAL